MSDYLYQSATFQQSKSKIRNTFKDQLNQSTLYDYLSELVQDPDEVYDRIVNIIDETLNQQDDEMRQDNIIYLKEIQNLSQQINELRQHDVNSRDENKYLTKTVQDIQTQMFKLEEENDLLREELGSQKGQIGQESYWKQEYLTLKEKYNYVSENRSVIENIDEDMRELESQRNNLEIRLIHIEQDHQIQIINMKQKHIDLEEVNERQLQGLKDVDLIRDEFKRNQIQLIQALKDVERLRLENFELKRESTEKKDRNLNNQQSDEQHTNNLLQENKDLKSKQIETLYEYENQKNLLDREITDLRLEMEDVKCQLKLMRQREKSPEQRQKLSEDLKQSSEQTIIKNMKDLIVKYRQQLDTEQRDHAQTKKQLQGVKQESSQIENELEKVVQQNEQLGLEAHKQNQKLTQMKNQVDDQKSQNQKILVKVQEYESSQHQLLIQNKTLNKEVQLHVESLRKIKRTYKSRFDEMKLKLKLTFSSIFKSLQLEKESIKIKTRQTMTDFMHIVSRDTTRLVQSFMVHHKNMNTQVLSAQQEIYSREWSDRSELLRNQLQSHFLHSKEKMENDFREKIKSLNKQILEQQSAFEVRQNENQTSMNIQRDQLEQAEGLIVELKDQLDQTMEHFQNQMSDYHQQLCEKDDIIMQQQKKAQDNQDHQITTKQMEVINEQYETDQSSLRDELQSKETNLQKLSTQIEQLQDELQRLEEINKKYSQMERNQIIHMQVLQREKQDLQSQLEHYQNSMKDKGSEMEILRKDKCQEMESLRKEYNDKQSKFQEEHDYVKIKLMQETEALKVKCRDLKEMANQSDVEREKLKRKLMELESQLSVYDKPTKDGERNKSDLKSYSRLKYEHSDQDKEVNMIVAKYKYETFKSDNIMQVEDNHLKRLQNIKSGMLRPEKYS